MRDEARESLARAILSNGYALLDEDDEQFQFWEDADQITRNTCYMQADALLSALHHDGLVVINRVEMSYHIEALVEAFQKPT